MISIEGKLVSLEKTVRGRIEIGGDGLIVSVGKETGLADVVLKDELIFPGFIDLHVHARECQDHSWDYKEDFTTAGQAAINGGVVAFADMPNNPVPPVDEESYEAKCALAKKSAVDVVLYAGMGRATKPLPAKMRVPYKVFMGQSVGDLFFKSRADLAAALEKYRGQSVSFHCEDPEILEANKNQLTHILRRPPEAEISAIDFALALIEKYELQGKICHCSTMEGLQKIISAKKSGLPVTVEVTPQHLFFDKETPVEVPLKYLQMNPPVRQSKENRLALIAALKNGGIDYLATDHAPHTIREKEQGTSGLPQLDTYGPIAAWLMVEHNFSGGDIARVCSLNPGQWFNKFSQIKFGRIEPGYAGSLSIINMNKPIIISKTNIKTKCAWSPFEGVQFPGRVVYTIVKGKVYKNDI
jgi:dihydroorotase